MCSIRGLDLGKTGESEKYAVLGYTDTLSICTDLSQ